MNKIGLLLLLSLIVACGENKQQKDVDVAAVPADTRRSVTEDTLSKPVVEQIAAPVKKRQENIRVVEEDTIRLDELRLPDIAKHPSVRILPTGSFHQDEVWKDAPDQEWFGLFKSGSGYYVQRTELKLENIHDPILDEEGEATGWLVSTTNPDTCILLISGVALEEKAVPGKEFARGMLLPGDTLYEQIAGQEYTLYAQGFKRKVAEDWHEVYNYKLFIQSQKHDSIMHQLIVAQPAFDSALTTILWAGDLDGDQLPDLIIDTSAHYNAMSPTLFLSSEADNTQLLKSVAIHTRVGC